MVVGPQVGVLAYDHECPKALTPEELAAVKAKDQAEKEARKAERAEAEGAAAPAQ